MSIARVLYILGIVLIVWSLISGIQLVYKLSESGSEVHSDYSFKIGLFLLGIVLVYLGRRSKKNS